MAQNRNETGSVSGMQSHNSEIHVRGWHGIVCAKLKSDGKIEIMVEITTILRERMG